MSDESRPSSGDPPGSGLAAHVVYEPRRAQIDEQWAEISSRIGARPRPKRWLAYPAVAALALVLGLLFRGPLSRIGAPPLEGTTVESAAGVQVLTLPDGAEVRLGTGAVVRVLAWTADRVALGLDRGEVTVDVPHVAGRTWIVSAGAFDVRVVGTRFVVRRERAASGDNVAVEVLRGQVEVVRRDTPDQARVLGVGESWRADEGSVSTLGSARAVEPAAASSDARELNPPELDAAAAEAPASPSAAAPAAPRTPSWEDLAKVGRYPEAYALLGEDGFSRLLDAAGPEKLLRLAEVARAAGRLRDAARAFDTLRRKHRGDGRAGLAAFELGRLRLDSLGSPAGAAEAFADAIALSPGGPLREDAEARRIEALHASSSMAACAAARDAYLARYPSGVHAALVRTRCSNR